MQLGIRLHDIHTGLGPEFQTMEKRAQIISLILK